MKEKRKWLLVLGIALCLCAGCAQTGKGAENSADGTIASAENNAADNTDGQAEDADNQTKDADNQEKATDSQTENADSQAKAADDQTEDVDNQADDAEKPLAEYAFEAGDFEGYNALLTVNGYQYPFALDFAADKMKLRVDPAAKEEIQGYRQKVFPVFVTDGTQEEKIGYISGMKFVIDSDAYVPSQWADGSKVCGKIVSRGDNRVTVVKAEETDRDTYVEFTFTTDEETGYTLSENVQYVLLDGNFVSTPVTEERFEKSLAGETDTVFYLFEKDGEVVQIWEPYIP